MGSEDNTNFTLSNDQFTQLLASIGGSNNNSNNKSKVDKIKPLSELTRSAIEEFLYEYQRKRKEADEMTSFMTKDVHDYVVNKATKQSLEITDINVTTILKELLTSLDSTMQYGSGRDYAKQLSWPVTGTVEERLVKFMQLAGKIEKRIPDINNVFVRLEFNKAICKVIPASFGLKENMVHHEKFKTLTGIEEFLKEHSWAVSLDENKKHTINRIQGENQPNNIPKENNASHLLNQVASILKEQNTFQFNQLKAEIKDLKNNKSGHEVLPYMFEMMRLNNNPNQQPYQPYSPTSIFPTSHTSPNRSFKPFGYDNNQQNKPTKVVKLLQQYRLPPTVKIYDISRTGEAIACEFKVVNQISKAIEIIMGHLDSGAFTTAGSYRIHAPFCKDIRDVTKETYLVLPNKECIRATKIGIMDVTVTNQDNQSIQFTNVLVFLVENEHWNELLIGRPTLKQYNLLPEQNFRVTSFGNNANKMANRMNENQNQNQNSQQSRHRNNNPLANFFVPANTNNNNAQS